MEEFPVSPVEQAASPERNRFARFFERTGDFFSHWLDRQADTEVNDTPEKKKDKKETSASSEKKRFEILGGFFGSFFKREVTKDTIPEIDEPSPIRAVRYEKTGNVIYPVFGQPFQSGTTESGMAGVASSAETINTSKEETDENEQLAEVIQYPSQPTAESGVASSRINQAPRKLSGAAEQAAFVPDIAPLTEGSAANASEVSPSISGLPLAGRSGEPLAAAVGLGLAAEDMARRRNRSRTERLERQVAHNRQAAEKQAEELKVIQADQSRKIEELEQQPESRQPVAESTIASAKVPEIETQPKTGEQPHLHSIEELAPADFKEVVRPDRTLSPEVVERKIEEAAERNIPIENLYELRHEIKDRPDEEYIAPAAEPVNSSTPVSPPSPLASTAPLTDHPSPMPSSELPVTYRKAAVSGVWAGLIILIVIALVLFLR